MPELSSRYQIKRKNREKPDSRPKRVPRYLGLSLLPVALFFLWEPNSAVFDLLPDLFGYLLLLASLSKLRDLNDYFETAYGHFSKMALVSFCKIVAFLLVLGFIPKFEQPDAILLCVFVYLVLDCLFLIPAWTNFFEGFSYLSTQFGVEPTGKQRRGKKPFSVIAYQRFTVFFVLFQSVLTLLPEFSALSNDVELNAGGGLYSFIPLMRVFAIIPTLIFGIIWFVRICRFVSVYKKDGLLLGLAREHYVNAVLPDTPRFIERNLKTAFFFLGAALFFKLDLRIDRINFTPDLLSAILFLIGLIFLGRHIAKGKKPFYALLLPFAALSVFANLTEYQFYLLYNPAAILRNEKAYAAYILALALKIAEQLLYVLLLACLVRMMWQVVSEHTGFGMPNSDPNAPPSTRILLIRKELKRRLILLISAGILSSVTAVLYSALAYYEVYGGVLDWFPLVDAAIAILFAIYAFSTFKAVYAQVENKYLLA